MSDRQPHGRMQPDEYAGLIGRVHETVARTVPAGARVLIVSKGDPSLVQLPSVDAGHFPRDERGGYAGYHPHDSEEAVAQLEELRRQGASYLVIPASSRWWLDHYSGLAEHLASEGRIVADEAESCLIFELSRRNVPVEVGDATTPRISIAQMRDYLEHLLSDDTPVLVLETVDGLAAALAPLPASPLAPSELDAAHRPGPGESAALTRLRTGEAEYLVLPREADVWLAENAHVSRGIEAGYRKVADQRHLCRVFALRRDDEEVPA